MLPCSCAFTLLRNYAFILSFHFLTQFFDTGFGMQLCIGVRIGTEGFGLQLSRDASGDIGAFYTAMLLVFCKAAHAFHNYYYYQSH